MREASPAYRATNTDDGPKPKRVRKGVIDMAGETAITLVGNLTDNPDLRYSASGVAVANLTLASTPRTFDMQAGQWRDGEPLFLRCTVWRQPAEHLVESLGKGARVIVTGRLVQRSFETQNGDKRTVTEVVVKEIGPSLRYVLVKVTKAGSAGSGDVQPAAAETPV
jgi:single-strand DNA-binding protein